VAVPLLQRALAWLWLHVVNTQNLDWSPTFNRNWRLSCIDIHCGFIVHWSSTWLIRQVSLTVYAVRRRPKACPVQLQLWVRPVKDQTALNRIINTTPLRTGSVFVCFICSSTATVVASIPLPSRLGGWGSVVRFCNEVLEAELQSETNLVLSKHVRMLLIQRRR